MRLKYTLSRRTQEVLSAVPSQIRTRLALTGPAQHSLHYHTRCHEHGLFAKIEEGETAFLHDLCSGQFSQDN